VKFGERNFESEHSPACLRQQARGGPRTHLAYVLSWFLQRQSQGSAPSAAKVIVYFSISFVLL